MKKYYFIVSLITVLVCACNKKINTNNLYSIETISFDMSKGKVPIAYDISHMIDTSYFEIIPLETNDDCLIAEISNIYLFDNKIVIYDERAKGAYIFNRDGSYHAKVRALGQGPGEYPDFVNDVNASENFIGVLASPGIMLYDYNGKFVKTISHEERWGRNIFTFDEINYYLVNCWSRTWSMSTEGYYHLFHFDTKQNKLNSYIPFSKEEGDSNRGWSLNKYYSRYDSTALIYISTIDTIYCLASTGEVSPQYLIDIRNKLPDDIKRGDGKTALTTAQQSGYEIGVKNIAVTPRYLFLKCMWGYAVYDKKEKKTIATAQVFHIPLFWNDISFWVDFTSSDGKKIVTYLNGEYVFSWNRYIKEQKSQNLWKIGDGITPFQKELIKTARNMKAEDDNPVLLIFKMKSEDERY